jgi:type I restriction enzyme, R subunit
MTTDTSEKGLESLIVEHMTSAAAGGGFCDNPEPFAGLHNWVLGNPADYDRAYAVDLSQLRSFVAVTQPHLDQSLDLDNDSPARRQFLARLQGEISKRSVIDVLRRGVKHGPHDITAFYATPSPGNAKAAGRFAANRFSVTRQLRYSVTDTANALDLALFVNGLPVATFELKNSLTKQTVADARRDPGCVRPVLPDDDPQRRDRPEQAPRPQERSGCVGGV